MIKWSGIAKNAALAAITECIIMERYQEEAVRAISDLVKTNSALAKGTPRTPFGEGAAKCLADFLALAEGMGFETHNYDNYVGEVIFGEGEEFAILCHLDVVPAGEGWTHDPFGGEVSDGKIWGRGTTDDKGPAVCALYALKALKDEGFVPGKKIKLIVGCNEECGWRCIEHYNEVAHMPETGFSPDADFPVIYAEKGILQLRFHFVFDRAPFLYMQGGSAPNMVCSYCEVLPRSIQIPKAESFGLKIKGKKLICIGKSAHGSTPELGENAMLPLLKYFEHIPEIKNVIDCLFRDKYGLTKFEDETGRLTMSPNVVKFRKGQLQIVVDIRYPASIPYEEIIAAVNKMGLLYETINFQPPLYHAKDSALVKTLAEVYEECTGQKAEPVAIGGGTYARALKNGVGFGPEFPGDPALAHQPDEYISVERVGLLIDIYKKAVERLTK